MSKVQLSWSFYDWANSAWSAIIITFIFSRYFVDVIAPNANIGTLYWTWAIGLSSLVAAFLSPFFGNLSDRSQSSKLLLTISTIIYAFIACTLWFVTPDSLNFLFVILIIFVGNISYEISQIFYNGQLKIICKESNYAKLSGFAWGLGYCGTVVIFLLYYFLFIIPENQLFGLDVEKYENIRISFPITGLWIIIFSLPLYLYFKDPNNKIANKKIDVKKNINEILKTLKDLKKYTNLVYFLIARLFYMDGINAIFAVAAIYATIVFGMSTTDIIMLGIGTNIAAGIGSWIFSLIENKFGSKNIIVFSLICIFIISTSILLIDDKNNFIILAIFLSSFFGPIQSASRVYFAKSIPNDKKYEFFGFYSFSGKVTAFFGPVLYGTVAYLFSSPKIGMASLLILFAFGLILLTKVENDFKKT